MFQFPGLETTMDVPEINRDPRRIHGAEQMWAAADAHLQAVIEHIKTLEPGIYADAGGNTDSSVLYDWMKGYIMVAEHAGGRDARNMTLLMCAAAVTRLVREDRTTDAELAQLDEELGNDDH